MVELWVFRHPASIWNEEKICQGQHQNAPGLSPKGWIQAERIAKFLSNHSIHSIYTSPARRALDLADLVQRHQKRTVPLFLDSKLMEINMGGAEDLTEEEIAKIYPLSWKEWIEKRFDPTLPCFLGGEVPEIAAQRLVDAFRRIAIIVQPIPNYNCGPVVVVSHGAALSFAFALIKGKSIIQAKFLDNGSLSKIVLRHGHIRIEELNSIKHLGRTAHTPKIRI